MISSKIDLTICTGRPRVMGNTYCWGNAFYISHVANAHVTSKMYCYSRGWICVVTAAPSSEKPKEQAEIVEIKDDGVEDIYREVCSLVNQENIMLEMVVGEYGSIVRLLAGACGSLPVYFSMNGSTIDINWSFERLVRERTCPILDLEYLVKSTFQPLYTHRTAFSGISMLTAGSSVVLTGGGVRYAYPASVDRTTSITGSITPDDAVAEFKRLLQASIQQDVGDYRSIGLELSGGLDSSAVALGVSSSSCSAIYSYGILISDPVSRNSQYQRRRAVIRSVHADDYFIDIRKFIPSLYSSAYEKYYLNAEAYGDAFESIWQRARKDGHSILLNGCGGDELFPQYAHEDFTSDKLRSIDVQKFTDYEKLLTQRLSVQSQEILRSAFLSVAPEQHADACTYLTMARRAPLLLKNNLIPIYPLRNESIIKFCAQLPLSLKLNKKVLELYLAKGLVTSRFTNYRKETFMHTDQVSLLRHRELYVKNCHAFKVVELGIVDLKVIKRDIEGLTLSTPRWVYDYLLNLLSIERFLRAYYG